MLSTQAPKSYKSMQSAQVTQSAGNLNDKEVKEVKEVKDVKSNPTHVQTINVVNINKTEDSSLIVEHDKDNHKFIIKDKSNILGHFTVGQIFKYINSDIEGFLISVDLGISVDLIEKFLFTIRNDETREIVIVSHLSSPITGNIELLVKLYKDIQSFDQTLQVEYEHLNDTIKNIVKSRNKNFIYIILTHIIKLFASFSSTNKKLTEDTKHMIISYSIGAVYRLNTMIKEDIDSNSQKISNLNNDLNNLKQIRDNMQNQMTKLENNIAAQNEKVDNLITNIQQKGGYDSSMSGATSSATINESSYVTTSATNTSNTDNTSYTNNTSYTPSTNKYNSSTTYYENDEYTNGDYTSDNTETITNTNIDDSTSVSTISTIKKKSKSRK